MVNSAANNVLPPDFVRGITHLEYPELFKPGDILSRRDVAKRAGRKYSTVLYHLERAVSAGVLNKQYGYIGNNPGWLYGLPETMPRLPHMSIADLDSLEGEGWVR